MSQMTPREIVQELDKHIIGQDDAKRAVAIALRNRWRRMQVEEPMRSEITPKNILMIGPTGVGKTEIARRLARLARAPFIKVEATKFTEVGYVGRDVESIVRDLMDIAIKMTREEEMAKVRHRAQDAAEDRILDVLLPRPRRVGLAGEGEETDSSETRQKFRKMLREGKLDDREIEVEVSAAPIGVEIMAPPGMEEMTSQLQGLFQNFGTGRTKTRKMKVTDAFKVLTDEESAKMINEEDLKSRALRAAEQNGIVFIDEIDKVTQRSDQGSGPSVSREGVQRDLLPLVYCRPTFELRCGISSLLAKIERAHEAVTAIQTVEAHGGTVHYHSVNLLRSEDMAKVMKQIRKASKRIDVLMHAGVMRSR